MALVAARLMRLLEINHLEYRLIHARILVDGQEREVWLNSSKNFRKAKERKLSLSAYVSLFGDRVLLRTKYAVHTGGKSRSSR